MNGDKRRLAGAARQVSGRVQELALSRTPDNAPDAFVEERARTQVDSKIGYIDRKLRVVIPPRYDWGFPFEHGKAVVCSGCEPKRDGEHWFVEGGLWGVVDRNGREIVPLQYRSREDLPK